MNLTGPAAARLKRPDFKLLNRTSAGANPRHFANVGRNHPDYGLTPGEHAAAKAQRPTANPLTDR